MHINSEALFQVREGPSQSWQALDDWWADSWKINVLVRQLYVRESSGLHHLQPHRCLLISKNTPALFTVVGPFQSLGSCHGLVAKPKPCWVTHEFCHSLFPRVFWSTTLGTVARALFTPVRPICFIFEKFLSEPFPLPTPNYITYQTAQDPWPRSHGEPFPAETYTHQRFSMGGKKKKEKKNKIPPESGSAGQRWFCVMRTVHKGPLRSGRRKINVSWLRPACCDGMEGCVLEQELSCESLASPETCNRR